MNMLMNGRTKWADFGCCDHCDRKNKGRKMRKRARHHARSVEKREWKGRYVI